MRSSPNSASAIASTLEPGVGEMPPPRVHRDPGQRHQREDGSYLLGAKIPGAQERREEREERRDEHPEQDEEHLHPDQRRHAGGLHAASLGISRSALSA